MLKGGGCGVAASPPHHTPQFPRMLSSYKISNIIRTTLLASHQEGLFNRKGEEDELTFHILLVELYKLNI
jgi:hypothetical protein